MEEALTSHVEDLNASTRVILEDKWYLQEKLEDEMRKRGMQKHKKGSSSNNDNKNKQQTSTE